MVGEFRSVGGWSIRIGLGARAWSRPESSRQCGGRPPRRRARSEACGHGRVRPKMPHARRVLRWRLRGGDRNEIVLRSGQAKHGTAHIVGLDRGGARLVEHPEEHLEIGAAGFGSKFVEHRLLLGLRHAVQGIEAGEPEVRVDHALPERADGHQILIQLPLAVGGRQDARARRGAHEHERTRFAFRGKLLHEHGAHGMTEQDGVGRHRLQEFGELGPIVGHADPDELLLGARLVLAMTDQFRRVAGPAALLEHAAKFVEAPGACRGAVQHHDMLGHAGPLPVALPVRHPRPASAPRAPRRSWSPGSNRRLRAPSCRRRGDARTGGRPRPDP